MMTEEQRYLFDLCGFLYRKNVLTPEELAAASGAAKRYIGSAPEDLPPHFGPSKNLKGFAHGFAFDRALEKLVFLPAVWPIVLELTNGKPMLASVAPGTAPIEGEMREETPYKIWKLWRKGLDSWSIGLKEASAFRDVADAADGFE